MEYPESILWVLLLSAGLMPTHAKVDVSDKNGKLTLSCGDLKAMTWHKGVWELVGENSTLDLGSVWNDPRGHYSCKGDKAEKHIYVFVRMCQNCIELDLGTITGFIVADVIMIVLIAVAVYCISGSETRRPARASDKQNLISNEQLYQPLGERQDGAYSQLTTKAARRK
ncbi:T-cell surface glycoprotein CD3 gamma chain-like isoform X2 [Ascaphus truei]|uniref:T-cell surface glycoprotein CD3 gamma chain-like isoform X2 n=1 Tax=Ascaphus truei TaxID=8439 RepID=UPI003F5AD20D